MHMKYLTLPRTFLLNIIYDKILGTVVVLSGILWTYPLPVSGIVFPALFAISPSRYKKPGMG